MHTSVFRMAHNNTPEAGGHCTEPRQALSSWRCGNEDNVLNSCPEIVFCVVLAGNGPTLVTGGKIGR